MTRESNSASLLAFPRWSFGLRQLFLWTATIALGLVALRSASMTWVAAMLGLALAVLTASILLVVFRRGSQRAYWIGFTTVGWMYLLLVFASWTLARMGSDDNPLRAHNLITQQLSSLSYHWLYDKAFEKYYANSSNTAAGSMSGRNFYVTTSDMGGGGEYDRSIMIPLIGIAVPNGSGPPAGPAPGPNESDFVNVAHALWALLFAAIGGSLAYRLYVTGPGQTDKPATASTAAS
jgi:hypothetical protein